MKKDLRKRLTINKELGDYVEVATKKDYMFDEDGVLMPVRLIKYGEKYEYAISYFGERRDSWGMLESTCDTVVGHTLKEVLDKYLDKTGRIISKVRGL